MGNPERVETESVRLRLQIAWEDHHHSRDQSWKSLQLVIVVFAALVGIDLNIENPVITLIVGIATFILSMSGFSVTLHHRNSVQVREFEIINKLQRFLGLEREELVWGVDKPLEAPKKIRGWDIFNPRVNNTPVFLMRTYFIISVLIVILVGFRLSGTGF